SLATSSKALSTDLRSSPRAGFRQPCGDVMIYGKVNRPFPAARRGLAIVARWTHVIDYASRTAAINCRASAVPWVFLHNLPTIPC
ncbi:hypothetical protein, partial [Paraburkholderia humisilvae]|uniref:hypothetical protein n=1 Tax=Paraburkholderia humisilvae TaxID=627669 RepID=UPI001C2E0A16